MEVLQDTYKDTKIGRIPKDWDVMMLNEITNYKSSNLSLNKLEENTGKYKLYGASGMLKGIDFYQTDKESFAIVKDGSGFGNLLWCDENSSILGTLGRITNKEISDLKFCFYLTHTIKFKRYMSGSTIPHLYYKDYGNIKLPVPPLPEQQKIAEILSTVDEQISTTDKIIEKSKELKKGLMQKLFSEGIGHTEFKDTKIGRIPKYWEVKQLASICDIVMGQSPPSESYNENDTGLPLVQGNADIKSRITKPRIYTSQITKISEVDDIIMTVRAPVGAIAKSNIKSCIGRGVCALRVKSIDNEFLYQMLIEKETSWIRLEQGSTFSAVNSKDIKTFKIALPPLQEQQKIATILSEADAKIEKEQTQKAQLEQLKKGLMQQLLTGKKRVNV